MRRFSFRPRSFLCSAGVHRGDAEVLEACGHVRKWRLDCEDCGETEEWWGEWCPPPAGQLFAVMLLVYITAPICAMLGGMSEEVSES